MIPAWSYTRLSDFESCAALYWYRYVSKMFPFVENQHTRRGNDVHGAIEKRIVDAQIELTQSLRPGQLTPDNISWVEAMIQMYTGNGLGGLNSSKLEVEYECAITKDFQPCDWRAKDCWHRAKLDLYVESLDGKHALIVDWKTGRHYPSKVVDQGSDYSMVAMALNPNLGDVETHFVYVDNKDVVVHQYRRSDYPILRAQFEERVSELHDAHSTNSFPPRPSKDACRFCPANIPGGCAVRFK